MCAFSAKIPNLWQVTLVFCFVLLGDAWAPGQIAAGEIASPTPGSTLGSSATFTWGGGQGVTDYILRIGSQWGWHDIFNKDVGLATSQEVTGLPTNGMLLYVEICSMWSGGSEACLDYPYQSAGAFSTLRA